MDKALIITLSNIGDLVMSTPLMEGISTLMPEKSIDVLGDARSSELLKNAPYISTIFNRDKKGKLGQQVNLFNRLRSQQYDLIVDLRTGFLPYLLHSQHKYIKRKGLGVVKHSVEESYSCIQGYGKFPEDIPNCKIYLSDDDIRKIQKLTKHLPPGKWLIIAPGANWPGKKWPAEKYGIIVKRALELKLFEAALIVGSIEDKAENLAIDLSNLPVLDLRGQTTLTQVAAVLSKADLFVGNDSGLGHIASGVGVRTITLFGPGSPQRYRPWGDKGEVIVGPRESLNNLEWQTVFKRLKSVRSK